MRTLCTMNACDVIETEPNRTEPDGGLVYLPYILYSVRRVHACVKILNSMENNLWVWSLCLALELRQVFWMCFVNVLYVECVCVRESSFYEDKDKVERNKQIKTHINSDKPVAIHKIWHKILWISRNTETHTLLDWKSCCTIVFIFYLYR